MKEEFSKHDWDHLSDCILHVTGLRGNREDLPNIFKALPEELKEEAYDWGMADTLWRDHFIEYFTEIKNNNNGNI